MRTGTWGTEHGELQRAFKVRANFKNLRGERSGLSRAQVEPTQVLPS